MFPLPLVVYAVEEKDGEQVLIGELKFAKGSSSIRYEEGDIFPLDAEVLEEL